MKIPVVVSVLLIIFLSSCATTAKTAPAQAPAVSESPASVPASASVPAPVDQVPEKPVEPESGAPKPPVTAIETVAVSRPQTNSYLSTPERLYRESAAGSAKDSDSAILLSLSNYPLFPEAREISLRLFPPEAGVYASIDGVLERMEPIKRQNDIQYFSSDVAAAVLIASGYDRLVIPLPQDSGIVEVKLEKSGGALTKVGEITTGHQPKSVRFTPDGKSVLVTNLGDFTAAGQFSLDPLLNSRNLQVPEEYRSDSGFVETLILQSRNEIWVSQMTIDTIHIFSLEGGIYKGSIAISGRWPKVLIASADESLVYASCWDSNKVIEIDPASRKEIRSFDTSGTPRGMAFSPDGKDLLVAIFSSSGIDRISLESGELLATYDAAPGRVQAMRHIVYSPALNEYYISAMGAKRVYRMSADGEWLGWWPVGDKPNTCVVSPDGKRLFVSCRGPNNPDIGYLYKGYEFGKIFVIDLVTGEVEDWIWGRDQPTGLDVSPDGRFIAFSNFLSNKLEIYRIN